MPNGAQLSGIPFTYLGMRNSPPIVLPEGLGQPLKSPVKRAQAALTATGGVLVAPGELPHRLQTTRKVSVADWNDAAFTSAAGRPRCKLRDSSAV